MRRFINKWTLLVLAVLIVGVWAINVHDWHQLWIISSAPDNIPIVAMLFLVPFFTWMGIRQAIVNDRLIGELEADTKLAKTHHRKVEPWRPGWAKELHVWPYLVRVEFLATVIVTVVLFIWSIWLNAPLEEPANPNLTMNPSKAPWYFLGLQELLTMFHPMVAGVTIPGMGIFLLILAPYLDKNPSQKPEDRKFTIGIFTIFMMFWAVLVLIGSFFRGPGQNFVLPWKSGIFFDL